MKTKRITVTLSDEDIALIERMATHWGYTPEEIMIISFKNGFNDYAQEYLEEIEEE